MLMTTSLSLSLQVERGTDTQASCWDKQGRTGLLQVVSWEPESVLTLPTPLETGNTNSSSPGL